MVRIICKDIIEVLDKVNEKNWQNAFQDFLNSSDSKEVLKRKIKQIYGGMGSFNDLVLYKDGNPCIKENQKLEELRKKLFEEVSR